MKKIIFLVMSVIFALTCLTACEMQSTQGATGADGKSAYEIWLDAGNTGSEEDFLDWLRQGERGEQGADGKSAYEIWLDAGYTGSKTDFLAWLKDNPLEGGSAAQPVSEGLDFVLLEDDTYKLVSLGICQDEYIVIPDTYNGKPVTVIGEYAFTLAMGDVYYNIGVKSIIMPDSITTIEDYAFVGCLALEEVVLSNNLTDIGKYIFSEAGYKFGIWKNGVRYVGSKNNPYMLALGALKSLTTAVIEDGCKVICDHAFSNCGSLTSVTISDSVTSIGSEAFEYCYNLTSVTIPNSVTSIGSEAFEYCYNLTSVTIPNSVTSIGGGAFYNCSSLTSVTIPNSVTSIGGEAFYNCSSLTSITIGNSVTSIGYYAFQYCSSLTTITIPNSVTWIGYDAFSGCENLTDIYFTGSEEEWDLIDKPSDEFDDYNIHFAN